MIGLTGVLAAVTAFSAADIKVDNYRDRLVSCITNFGGETCRYLTLTNAGCTTPWVLDTAFSAETPQVAVTPGKDFALTARVRGNFNLRFARGACDCRVDWFDAAGKKTGEPFRFGLDVGTNGWRNARVTGTVPPGAAKAKAVLGADEPNFRTGQYLAIAGMTFAEHPSGNMPADPEPPLEEFYGPRPTPEELAYATDKLTPEGFPIVDGKPFFPIGIYGVWKSEHNGNDFDRALEELKENGFNTVQTYRTARGPEFLAFLDAADRHGFKVFVAPAGPKDFPKGFEANIAAERRHPCILAWYIADDTSQHNIPAGLRRLSNACHACDPKRLTAQADGVGPSHLSKYAPFVDSTDVFLPEIYPVQAAEANGTEVPEVIRDMKTIAADLAAHPIRRKSVWPIIQHFDGWKAWHRFPTFAELRAMSYLAIIHGANGITWYTYSVSNRGRGAPATPEHWQELTKVSREIAAIADDLVRADAAIRPQVRILSGPEKDALGFDSISVRLKDSPKGALLLAVNSSTNAVRAVITADRPYTVDFKPYGVHVYRLKAGGGQDVRRRSEIAAFFEREVYGKVPPKPAKLAFDLVERGEAFGGLAERRQYRIVSTDAKGSHSFAALVYLPKGAERPAPAFVYPNFSGNHSIVDDPAVAVETGAVFGGERRERGSRTDRIPVKRLLERGFALATFCYCSVYPDYSGTDRDAAPESVYAIFPEERLTKPLLAHPAWTWGSMRVRDLLETLPGIDQAHVAVAGQSRMGKNAIVTGVNDDRFALVCANCGGTKQLKLLPNLKYPCWFAPGLRKYAMNGRTGLPVAELEAQARKMPDPPFEQSDYLGLIAPRALCVGAASEDLWSPPEASLACVRAAEPAFERHGRAIGWHCKKGPHSITAEDWEQYMDYALNQLGWHTAFSPAVPSANPDDQMRYIWGSHDGIHPWLKRYGFNTVIHATELETLPRFKADGFDFVRQCGGIVSNPALMKRYPRINRDGTKWERTVDASDPDYRRETHGKFAAVAQKLKALDCRVGVQPASELRIRTRPSHTPRHDAAFKAATGLDVPPEADGREAPHWSKLKDVPADRAIDENHPVLAYYRWFWEEGDGFGPVFADGERTVREALGYVPFSFMDPAIRVPPLWCGCPALSHLSQWQVVDPDPYQHAYIVSEVKAMARGNPGQRTLMMVQGIFGRWDADLRLLKGVDGGKLPDAPAWLRDRPLGLYITPPPDMFRESIWACLSRQIDGVGFHGWNCLFDGVPFGDKKTAAGYVFTNDRTTNVIDEVFNTVAVPLGPLFKAAEERAPEVAVLESYTSALLSGKAPWDWKLAGFHCGVRATAANLAPYTLYEEEIARYGIPLSVKVILAPECEIVTKTTARALREFRARGGRIVGDAKLAPAVTADAQLSADPAELGAIVRRFMTPYAASDRPTLLASARIAGSADLVFVLNDNRTFGDYIGQWRRIREKGLPERGTVTVNRSAGAVYDLVAHQPVPFTSAGGRTAITVAFASCGGKALLVTEKPLGKLAVAREGDELVVRSPDGAMIPVGLFSSDGRPRYGIIRNGVWRTRAPAGNAKVVNLATGEEFLDNGRNAR